MDLKGKIADITGAAGGIGAEIARVFARAGAKVVLGDVQKDRGLEVLLQINALNGQSIFVPHDTTIESEWVRFIDTAIDTFGGLDILVNNAAIEQTCFIENIELSDIEKLSEARFSGRAS